MGRARGRGRGRGRGKGKKQTVASHEDIGSGGEEVHPTYKRRGRPQKPLKNDIAEETEQIEEYGDDDEVKPSIPNKEVKSPSPGDGTKRKKQQQVNLEDSDSNLEDNGTSVGSSIEDSTRSNGFRQNRSRRKNKPHRAAEAGVECRL